MDPLQIVLVTQLLARYGHVVDDARWDRFEELFVPDAVLDFTGVNAPSVLHGIEQIRTYFRAANHPSAHHVVNVDVWEEQAAVRVRSKFFAPYTRASHDSYRWYGGDYDDIVVLTPEGWRFRSRLCTARWQLAAQQGPVPEGRGTW
jgi:3-phenylpropionate/cinnamic acid dioxygenase small subunit